ncbi:MAG: DUF2264 domain-containing protein [Pseudomonadota bacterium]
MMFDPVSANPLSGNPLKSRRDVQKAVRDVFAPLLPYFPLGASMITLNGAAAHYSRNGAGIEAVARPLWGLVPLAAGGGEFEHWDRFERALANGTDPNHPEYWGTVSGNDQRMVEMASIGFALRSVPEKVWEPLTQREKDNVAAYLTNVRRFDYANNNWKFFRVILDLGLKHVGVEYDESLTEQYLEELEGFYLADGWYRDGPVRRADHYIGFAMHFYGLIYATLNPDDPRSSLYRERAEAFAKDIRWWFDDEGGALAFGRSLTYRFACAGFWASLAFANIDVLPWGEVKGHFLRHVRWWSDRPISDRDGVLSIGYGFPNPMMAEWYNSPGSPYWAMKAFLPLALPEEHPFWQAEEAPAPVDFAPMPLKHAGMVMMRTKGNAIALSSGQQNLHQRFGPEKYAKFVYSSRYGFSVEHCSRSYDHAAIDGMIGFSEDGLHFRVRETNEDAQIAGDALYARWHPWPDVEVETWLLPRPPWHVRVHRIKTPRRLQTTEGGFAIADDENVADELSARQVVARSQTDISAILNLTSGQERVARALEAAPNTNLVASKTIIPQLRGAIAPGETVLVCAVMAGPKDADIEAAVAEPPDAPDLGELEDLFARDGVVVTVFDIQE